MASESDKSSGKDEGEVKSTPSIIKPKGRMRHRRWFLVLSDTKGTEATELYIFIFCTVLFPFLTIVDEKIFFSKACFNRQLRRKVFTGFG